MHVVYIEDITWPSKDTEFLRGTQGKFPPKCIENTFQAIQSTFSSLEMHFKRCYKICICSVVLGQLESFRNYKGLRIIFPKILDAILSFTKVRVFLIPPSIACLDPKILGFLFLRKTGKLGYWNAKNWTLENRREFIRYVTQIAHEWNGHLEIFSLPLAIENSRQFLLLRTDILQKTVFGCPWFLLTVEKQQQQQHYFY